MTMNTLRYRLEQIKGQRDKLKQEIKQLRKEIKLNKKQLITLEQAKEILREVARQTQDKIKTNITAITTLALESVFGKDIYQLGIEFTPRRNKVECDIYLIKDGKRMNDPLFQSGGGAIDVASFALRIACWGLSKNRSRPVFILDEPFKHLSADLLPNAAEMLTQLKDRLGIQFIIASHEKELWEAADKISKVKMINNISKVKEVV